MNEQAIQWQLLKLGETPQSAHQLACVIELTQQPLETEKQWEKFMEIWDSADAVRVPSNIYEGLVAVRKISTTNMLDIQVVRAQAAALGWPEVAEWIQTNQDNYVNGIFQGFKPEH